MLTREIQSSTHKRPDRPLKESLVGTTMSQLTSMRVSTYIEGTRSKSWTFVGVGKKGRGSLRFFVIGN
jgi:hypothetical protein